MLVLQIFRGCIPQILLGPFLKTLFQMSYVTYGKRQCDIIYDQDQGNYRTKKNLANLELHKLIKYK